jgi:hypothetical protein
VTVGLLVGVVPVGVSVMVVVGEEVEEELGEEGEEDGPCRLTLQVRLLDCHRLNLFVLLGCDCLVLVLALLVLLVLILLNGYLSVLLALPERVLLLVFILICGQLVPRSVGTTRHIDNNCIHNE